MARIAVGISRLVLSPGLGLPRQQSAALEGRHMVSALEEVRGGGAVVAVARIAIVSLCSLMDSASAVTGYGLWTAQAGLR